MSRAMDDDFEEQRLHLQAVTEFAGRTGPVWLEQIKPELATLPNGTIVVVNCETGEYVTGKGMSEACSTFESRFGKTVGWIHEIGGGFFVGGGIA
jgi:hypothetical protein